MSSAAMIEPVPVSVPRAEATDTLYEVVNGQRVEKPPMGARANRIAFVLAKNMDLAAEPKQLGHVGTETIFLLDPEANLQRRPDAYFVSFARWPTDQPIPDTDPWPVVPNVAVEVISPTNLSVAMQEKVEEYFRAGVERVWLIYPQQKVVYDYESATNVRILTAADTLDGGSILPDLHLPLADLFR